MTSRWQRKLALSGFLSAVVLAPPVYCWADTSAAASAAIDGTDVVTGHGFNLLLYLPAGLIAAAILLEWFAQWKGNRDVEPGILFLLFSAGGAAVVTALLALAFATVGRQSGELSAFCTWMVVVAGFAALAFFLKRKGRDRKLFALRPPPNLSGRVVVPRTSTQKTLIVGYRIALIFALLVAMAGISEMPVGNVPLKSLAGAIRSVTGSSAAPAATVASSARPEEAKPAARPATPEAPKLADLIGQRSPTTPPPGEQETKSLIEAATASIQGQPAIVPSPDTPGAPAVAAASSSTPPPETPSATPPPESPPPPTSLPPASSTPPATIPTAASTTTQPRPVLDKNFFATRIKPILDTKCTSCHGSSKQKADLRLDSVAAIRKGSDHPIIVPGNPDASEIYSRLTSTDEEEMMPPKEKNGPLPAAQIELFKTWILAGADFGDGSPSTAMTNLPAQAGGQTEEMLSQKLAPPDAALLARLSQAGVVIRPLSSNGALLEMNFSHADLPQLNLAELAPIAKNIYALDLTRTKIRDEALAPVAQFSNLRRLQLNRNPITDAALVHLKTLTDLESLNLYDTGVTDTGLDQLNGLKKLQKLYLFNTKCTAAGADKLKAQIPGVDINLGG
jgi:hypothetical protein